MFEPRVHNRAHDTFYDAAFQRYYLAALACSNSSMTSAVTLNE